MTKALGIIGLAIFCGASVLSGCSSDDDDEQHTTTGGTGGTAGEGGMACTGEPPVTDHNTCSEIPSQKLGDEAFVITSPDFAFCAEMPAKLTCDGKDFGTGESPTFKWSGAPAGTMSFAAVFKDISILADGNPATERFGYHWVMWDIPATVMELPGQMAGGYHSMEVPGAVQWSSLGSYGFFTPCPNPFPEGDAMFGCSLVRDSYSLTLYALPLATLEDLPPPDTDPMTGQPAGNWVVNMAHYIEGLTALGVTEYRGTSKAWAAAFVPPSAAQFPCTKDQVEAGMTASCLH
jgi:phosphatidylethanolamine-binding protein (PEBP) family uncharacterized protein